MKEHYYSFLEDEAIKYGLDEAIFIRNFPFENRIPNLESDYDQEKTWFKLSITNLSKALPFCNERQIRRILNSLKQQKILLTENFNESHMDRTLWYTINSGVII